MRQAIQTSYHGPTNHRGSRVKATCDAQTMWVPWDYSLGAEENHRAAAEQLARGLGWLGLSEKLQGGRVGGKAYWVVQ